MPSRLVDRRNRTSPGRALPALAAASLALLAAPGAARAGETPVVGPSRTLIAGGTTSGAGFAVRGRVAAVSSAPASGDGVEVLGGQLAVVVAATTVRIASADTSSPTDAASTVEVSVTAPAFLAPTVELRHAPAGRGTLGESVAMSEVSAGRFAGDVPISSLAGARGAEFDVRVNVASAWVPLPPTAAGFPRRIESELDELAPGGPLTTSAAVYGMVGFPVELNPADAAGVLDELGEPDVTRWRFSRHDPDTLGQYDEFDGSEGSTHPLDAGNAFWLITRNATAIGVSGLSRAPESFGGGERGAEITLRPGWNQIANPFAFDVDPSDIQVQLAGESLSWADATGALLEGSPLRAYDPGSGDYVTATVFEPWTGYFVLNAGASEMTWRVPYREREATRERTREAPVGAGWSARLTVRDGDSGRGRLVVVGLDERAAAGIDDLDVLEAPPPPGGSAASFFCLNDAFPAHARRLQRDVRPLETAAADTRWELRVVAEAGGTTVLDIDGLDALPPGSGARLLDVEGRRAIDLDVGRPSQTYSWTSSGRTGARSLVLLVGAQAFVESETEEAALPPTALGIRAVTPNPARARALISFGLPGAVAADLRVFDVQGRLVRRLVSEALPGGVHVARWDLGDERGTSVAPGVYVVRLVSGREVRTRRLVIVR